MTDKRKHDSHLSTVSSSQTPRSTAYGSVTDAGWSLKERDDALSSRPHTPDSLTTSPVSSRTGLGILPHTPQKQVLPRPGNHETPSIILHPDSSPSAPPSQHRRSDSPRCSAERAGHGTPVFQPITISIPTGSLENLASSDAMAFSKRGSIIMLNHDGPRMADPKTPDQPSRKEAANTRWSAAMSAAGSAVDISEEVVARQHTSRPCSRSTRALSSDEALLSIRVRSMYELGTDDPIPADRVLHEVQEEDEPAQDEAQYKATTSPQPRNQLPLNRVFSCRSNRTTASIRRDEHELAGGIEDWEDVDGGEVDRYGFITKRHLNSRDSNKSGPLSDSDRLQRSSTLLFEASNTPRRRGLLRRTPPRSGTNTQSPSADCRLSRQASKRSVSSQISYRSPLNRSLPIRSPFHSKDQRMIADASYMLTLLPGLSAHQARAKATSRLIRRREHIRETKWQKMGRLKPGFRNGSGMHFEFDPKDPKVIARTWKGIPDRWRAAAWYSFLEGSANQQQDDMTEAFLIDMFHESQVENCADDVQIDCDVPRTISRHIMFRRRYRGGQRLLFRVLHALSLLFPDVGYVQGMAALAATLLCYYDEDHAFVMMARLGRLRGLQRLYETGFEGLMDCLTEFEADWLGASPVAKKLEELSIPPTSYGTRWYLTLFNYSIPFPAQLRIWDVFMLLGDQSNRCPSSRNDMHNLFGADLDILHATSAALIDGIRDLLLVSDFENAMKILTSWIPIRDEDFFMKVVHAEWKKRKRRGVKAKSKVTAALSSYPNPAALHPAS